MQNSDAAYSGLNTGQEPNRSHENGNVVQPRSYFCTQCGSPVPALNLYCIRCGTYLADTLKQENPVFGNTPLLQPLNSQISADVPASRTKIVPWMLAAIVGVALLFTAVLLGSQLLPSAGVNNSSKINSAVGAATERANLPTLDEIKPTNYAPGAVVQKPISTTYVVKKTPEPRVQETQPTATSTVKPSVCSGAPKQRLEVGKDARVCTRRENVFLRSGPGRSYTVLKKVAPGTLVEVIGGPECANNWSFWEVELSEGMSGWMSEGGDAVDPYFLCPVQP